METYRLLKEDKNEIKADIINELTPAFMQAADNVRNSNEKFVGELKEIVEKRISGLEARVSGIEGMLRSKWLFVVVLAVFAGVIAFNIILLSKEKSLEKRDDYIEYMFKLHKNENNSK